MNCLKMNGKKILKNIVVVAVGVGVSVNVTVGVPDGCTVRVLDGTGVLVRVSVGEGRAVKV